MNQIDSLQKQFFTKNLLDWAAAHPREMPWKGEKNPYLVWLSEIILQQTRVEQGLPYFLRFREKYPTVAHLAQAEQDEVMKLWEGLGYYSRARNLHATAKNISQNWNGIFPDSFAELRSLKGVGDYTAAAVASFAFDLPHAVVDGNVYRVLARFFGIAAPTDTTEGKKEFATLAQQLLDGNEPARYNQAIMDFGATHCTPAAPNCVSCLLQEKCVARLEKKVQQLPVKSKKIIRSERFFNYFDVHSEEKTWIKRREEKDIWQHLYEFPLIETTKILTQAEIEEEINRQSLFGENKYTIRQASAPIRHQLTHRTVIGIFWEVKISEPSATLSEDYLLVERKNLSNFAFSRLIVLYFQNKTLLLF